MNDSAIGMEELRKSVAEILGEPTTWPDHGNIPLAVAATVALLHAGCARMQDEIERLMSTLAQVNAKCDSLGIRLGEVIKERDALKTVMVAAAEEIHAHWSAHCDAEGYGPANLMRRLEEGIPSEYGYTAGAFARLTNERDALKLEAAICREAIEQCLDIVQGLDCMSDSDSACQRVTLRRLNEAIGEATPRLLYERPEGQRLYGLRFRELAEERDALRMDAERYRWLCVHRLGWFSRMAPIPWKQQSMKDALDAAIDTARKEKP